MQIVYQDEPDLRNLDVLERLAAAWNPPDVDGSVCIAEGSSPHTFHLCIRGTHEGRRIQVFGTPLDKALLSNPDHRKTLARETRNFLASALAPYSDRVPRRSPAAEGDN